MGRRSDESLAPVLPMEISFLTTLAAELHPMNTATMTTRTRRPPVR
jgi:hypothetical protein